MAIRERFNRIIRRSAGSSTSSTGSNSDDGHTDPTTSATTSASSSRAASSAKPTTPAATPAATPAGAPPAASPWLPDGTPNPITTSPQRPQKPSLMHRPLSFFNKHPKYRIMTEENLRWQESLGTYTMQFGRSRPSSRSSMLSDISPCNSRAGSLDLGPRRMSIPLGPKDEIL